MQLVFTVVDEDGIEHESEPINGFNNWRQVGLGAVVYAHIAALKIHKFVKIKGVRRIDI